MEFRLLYQGRLLSGNKPHPQNKHELRLNFSPQIKQLIHCKPNLRSRCNQEGWEWFNDHPDDREVLNDENLSRDDERRIMYGFWERLMSEKWSRGGLGFIPIITEDMDIRCKLDILFLRPSPPGKIIERADIDNRLKVLIDSLKVPETVEKLPPSDGPIYCLFSDDSLISEIRVVSDQLLLLPGEKELGPNDAFLVIGVDVESPPSNMWHQAFS